MNFLSHNLSEHYNNILSFEDLCEKEISERIVELVGKSQLKVLDLGGGTGKFSEHFRSISSWDITIADYSESMLEQARMRNFKTVLQDINDINIDDKFDVILVKFCIHYVKDNKNFYNSLSKILNKNGKVFIITRPQRTDFPFSERLHQKWEKSQPTVDELISFSEINFKSIVETMKFPITWKIKKWRNLIMNKAFSIIDDEDVIEAEQTIPDSDDDITFYENNIIIQLILI